MRTTFGRLKEVVRGAARRRRLEDLAPAEREEFEDAFEDYGTTWWDADPETKRAVARQFGIELG